MSERPVCCWSTVAPLMRTGMLSNARTLRVVHVHDDRPQNDRQQQREQAQRNIMLLQNVLHLPAPPFHISRIAASRLFFLLFAVEQLVFEQLAQHIRGQMAL